MTITVRSVTGNQQINDSTPNFDSPSSITAGDLLVLIVMINDSAAQTITPDSGWTEEDTVSDATSDTRYMVFTKTAVSADATNQGTTDYYTFTGMNGTDDLLYGLYSIYDDAAGTITYRSSSLAGNAQSGAISTNSAPSQTVGYDVSLAFLAWVARGGTTQFEIDLNEAFTLGSNPTLDHGPVDNAMGGSEWVFGRTELGTGDSPTGTFDLSHNALPSDSNQFSMSCIFEVVSGASDSDVNFYGSRRGIGRGIARGIG